LAEVRLRAARGDERCRAALKTVDRLPADSDRMESALWAMLHRAATQMGRSQYVDPATGFSAFTATFLKKQMPKCCNLGCRHCPYTEGEKLEQKQCQSRKIAVDW